jgi:4-carboxymuconolactone decarboxylase
MSRLPPATRDQLDAEHQAAYDELTSFADKQFGNRFSYKREDGAFVGPFPLFVAAPQAGVEFLKFVGKLATLPGLSLEARETAILAVGARFEAGYELYAHSNVAKRTTKLKEAQIDEICNGEKPDDLSEECDVAYDVAEYLASTPGALPIELWDRAMLALGKEGTVALIHYVGFYAYTCIILNAMDAPVPEKS